MAANGREWNPPTTACSSPSRPPHHRRTRLIIFILRHWLTRKATSGTGILSRRRPTSNNAKTKTFITYNDAETELARTKYVREHHLGGIMFWQSGHDPDNVLLDAIDQGFGMKHRK